MWIKIILHLVMVYIHIESHNTFELHKLKSLHTPFPTTTVIEYIEMYFYVYPTLMYFGFLSNYAECYSINNLLSVFESTGIPICPKERRSGCQYDYFSFDLKRNRDPLS